MQERQDCLSGSKYGDGENMSNEKDRVSAYFDKCAPQWDAHLVRDNGKIERILDSAGVERGSVVLDVATGTGVLYPYYARRGVAQVTAVDLSSEMARIAADNARKYPMIRVVAADVTSLAPNGSYTSCVVYNAMPHFDDKERLFAALHAWCAPGGRLTVAHSMGREALQRHHMGHAASVTFAIPDAEELADIMRPWFDPVEIVSEEDIYLVSAIRRELDGE